MEAITEKLKRISKEDIVFFIAGISFGLLIYLLIKAIRAQKRMEAEMLDIFEETREAISQKEEEREHFTEKKESIFPLKRGKSGKEVKQLQAYLIGRFNDEELEDSEEYQIGFFGDKTFDCIVKHTSRHKGAISQNYFETKVIPYFMEEEKED